MYAICSSGRISSDFGSAASAGTNPVESNDSADSCSNSEIAMLFGAWNSKLLFNYYSLSLFPGKALKSATVQF